MWVCRRQCGPGRCVLGSPSSSRPRGKGRGTSTNQTRTGSGTDSAVGSCPRREGVRQSRSPRIITGGPTSESTSSQPLKGRTRRRTEESSSRTTTVSGPNPLKGRPVAPAPPSRTRTSPGPKDGRHSFPPPPQAPELVGNRVSESGSSEAETGPDRGGPEDERTKDFERATHRGSRRSLGEVL